MPYLTRFLFGVFALLSLAACGGGQSPADSVLQSNNESLRATIAFYESMDPTATAVAAQYTTRMATLQTDLERTRQEVRNLTLRLNSGGAPPPITGGAVNTPPASSGAAPFATPAISNPGGGGFSSIPTFTPFPTPAGIAPVGTPPSVRSATGLALEGITLALGIDNNGCAVNATNNFLTTSQQIYVVAIARNFQSGTVFSTNWTNDEGFQQRYDWTTPEAGDTMCVHFYVEPGTLEMTPGNYFVTFTAQSASGGTAESPRLPFVIR